MGNAQGKARGKNKYSRWDNAVPPAPPGKPAIAPGSPKNQPDLVTLRWEPPVNDGGAPVRGYLVEHRRTGSPHWVRATPDLVVGTAVTLSGLEPGWRYQFRVSAENCAGLSDPSELSEPLTVTLSRQGALAPHFVLELKDMVALENDKVEFVAVVRGHPTPAIAWHKDGSEVFSDRRMRIVTEKDQSMLVIFQASFGDEGEIKCSATNRLGHSVSRARLKIEAPPSIRLPRQYEDGLVFEKDEMLRLKVSVAGRPLPRVAWSHEGRPVKFGGRHEVRDTERSSSLRVVDARRSDSGEYKVKATNRLGEDVATFTVTVTDRPLPPGKPQIAMILGRSLTLSWAEPEDDGGFRIETYIVEYYRLGWNVWLKAATCRQLTTTLGDLIEGSEYRFRVKADNPCGVSDPSPESDVIFIPDPRRGLLQAPTRSRSINMGDMENRLREEKNSKQSELNRMSKEINLRTTSAGTLQTDRNSVIPKNVSKKGTSNEEISGAQFKKTDSLPSTVTKENDRLVGKRPAEKESQQKRIVDDTRDLNTSKKIETSAKKTSYETLNTNTSMELKASSKSSLEESRNVPNTNITKKSIGNEKETDAGFKTYYKDKELKTTPKLLTPPLILGMDENKDGSHERIPDNTTHPVPALKKSAEQPDTKETGREQYSSPLSPREDDDSIIHGSSELMLVLLPEERETKPKKGTDTTGRPGKSAPKDGSPPRLSLSAPALDLSGSHVLPPLRNAVSSSQLLHEKAMARFYEAVEAEEERRHRPPRSPVSIRVNSVDVDSGDEEETRSPEREVASPSWFTRRSYQEYEADIGRVRSKLAAVGELKRQSTFRKSLSQEESEPVEAELEDEAYDEEEDEDEGGEEDVEEEEEEMEEEDEVLEEEEEEEGEIESEEEEEEIIEEVPKRQHISAYESRKTLQQKLNSLSQDDEDYEDAEDMTYHPRSMVPVAVAKLDSTDSLEQKGNSSPENNLEERHSESTPPANFAKHERKNGSWSEEELIERRNDAGDVGSAARESAERSDGVVMRQRRAEAPETPGQEVENIDADVALSAAEIARQRRLKVRQKSVEEDVEANQAIVNLYGDIIREYGSMRKAPTVMYLNTEDLKKAAYSSEETDTAQEQHSETAPPKAAEQRVQADEPSTKVNHHEVQPKKQFGPQPKRKKPGPLAPPAFFPPPEVRAREIRLPEPSLNDELSAAAGTQNPNSPTAETAKNPLASEEQMKMDAAGRNVKFFVSFLTDLALFAVACWLYFFKDERLAIPVLVFMVYRQAMDAIKKYLPERWTRR
ncbi:titin homolog [Bacillus rossius redtenbacheri]|uniref:titin homolog n=1 Tax=Bacillus rossius redtenbacheri TaxID=93214 RepID=UPI002FDE6939